jgi:hydrogenase maturation protein HypF
MNLRRVRIELRGAVQGVGFRPFVYRLANELRLCGWVLNSPHGVCIEVEGAKQKLRQFQARLETDKPRIANITDLHISFLEPVHDGGFKIRDSVTDGEKNTLILPDIATCPDCVRELFDPNNRRYLYPFINCTNCGPRFSIIEGLPYDRRKTSMKRFSMCPECEREYHDPNDRRFHAQPNACPKCGPRMELWDDVGHVIRRDYKALAQCVEALRSGKIVAIKGIGGFQLLVDAGNEDAVRRLRERKRRPEKPFALMFPSLRSIEKHCCVSEIEEHLLLSFQSPIVLLEKLNQSISSSSGITFSVAPRNPYLGVMLPYSPLHHILLHELNFPVVATSGNISAEPICTDEREALERLGGIADVFLVHNRPIVRRMDDSIVRVMLGRELVLRSARGYAPMAIPVDASPDSESILSVGGQLKNTVALKSGGQIFISQHIGDLETEQAFTAFQNSCADLPRLYESQPDIIACDLHPNYLSTKFAQNKLESDTAQSFNVQHHYAHILGCMAENRLEAPALGICWDGTGYGLDGTIWGGEFLLVDDDSFQRVAHLRQFRLPGGDAAVKQPRRTAVGLLYEILGNDLFKRNDALSTMGFSDTETGILERMMANAMNSPLTSSAGRLFDAVACLLDLRHRVDFEGQAAMDLEFSVQPGVKGTYNFELRSESPIVLNWESMVLEILDERQQGRLVGSIAAKFHNTLVEMIVSVARAIGERNIVFTGGCFQNTHLTEQTVRRLRDEGFIPHWHRRVPPNDGGIALGQIMATLRMLKSQRVPQDEVCAA